MSLYEIMEVMVLSPELGSCPVTDQNWYHFLSLHFSIICKHRKCHSVRREKSLFKT